MESFPLLGVLLGLSTHCYTQNQILYRINRACSPAPSLNCSEPVELIANFYNFDPVCGMRKTDGKWYRVLFLNCLMLNHANICQKVDYTQCEGGEGIETLKKLQQHSL